MKTDIKITNRFKSIRKRIFQKLGKKPYATKEIEETAMIQRRDAEKKKRDIAKYGFDEWSRRKRALSSSNKRFFKSVGY